MKKKKIVNKIYGFIGSSLCASAGAVAGFIIAGPMGASLGLIAGFIGGHLFEKGLQNFSV